MPVLRVTKNGVHLCIVGSNDVWMFSASVWAELWGLDASLLDVSGGGKRRSDGTSDFLIWEMPHILSGGDRVRLSFEEGEGSSPDGKVFDPSAEPLGEPEIDMSFPPTAEDIAKLEARPHLNAALVWNVSINDARSISLAPDAVKQHIGIHVLWNEEKPHRMRVSVSKSSVREIFERKGGEELFLEYVPLGSCIEVNVGAMPDFRSRDEGLER